MSSDVERATEDRRPIESLTFEETYARLQAVVDELDRSTTSLERSVELYELGIRLAQHAEALLNSAELRVTRVDTGDGRGR